MNNPPNTAPTMSRTQVLIAIGVTALVLFGVAKLWLVFGAVDLVPLSWQPWHLAIGIGSGLAISAMSHLFYKYWDAYRLAAEEYLNVVLKPLNWSDLIWLAVLPAMSEELLFRGVALPAVGMNLTGLLITSVVFGALHMASRRHLPYTLWAALVGIAFGTMTIATQNLLPAITAHAITNGLSSLIWKYQQSVNASQG
ncbi:MAG: lysostaphin resistance A-like protein [Pseudanabaenaceae cyanobacterium]|jgi:uncharacterized protein